jgi:hypothetical protein
LCGGDGQCHAGTSCSVDSTTVQCLQTRDKSTSSPDVRCSSCATANGCLDPAQQGGTCEAVAGNATLFSGALPDGQTCAQVVGASSISESAICFQTLTKIFSSSCAATLQETPCLCGATNVNSCLAGTAAPTGAAFDIYACDFDSTNGATVNNVTANFTVQSFGAGMANSIVQCAASFGCDCF